MSQQNVISHTGDLGDIIACLPILRSMGGGSIVLHAPTGKRQCRESLEGARFNSIKPLLEAQPYVDSVLWCEHAQDVAHDFSTFRQDHRHEENLIQWQARHIDIAVSETPWLIAKPDKCTKGRAVFARSRRYHSEKFPWEKALARWKDPLFVGLEDEYLAFQTKWGKPIEHYTAENLLELAQLIAGCEMFVGNQSCPFWIAAGLGVPLIQEVWTTDPNSIVLRDNAGYALNGTLPI